MMHTIVLLLIYGTTQPYNEIHPSTEATFTAAIIATPLDEGGGPVWSHVPRPHTPTLLLTCQIHSANELMLFFDHFHKNTSIQAGPNGEYSVKYAY